MSKALFIAATAQHVGKTTTCLGIVSGLLKRFEQVGFCKPVGQRHVEVEGGHHVDKDVVLFKERFDLQDPYPAMSPVIVPGGFTRKYLDGKIDNEDLRQRIHQGFGAVRAANQFTVVEGTGHTGVGSVMDLNNADVAAALGLDVILVSTGGVGAAFDQLALNYNLLQSRGVRVRGIILNKVIAEKRDMVVEYISKAIKKWGVPLAGCIPYNEFLHAPTMRDYEQLFGYPLLSGEIHRYRHFLHERLVVTTEQQALHSACPSELIITHASREDIVRATIEDQLERGIILAGHEPPSDTIIEEARAADVPLLYVPLSSYRAMQMIANFTAKIRREDVDKVDKAIQLVEENINFEVLL